jgi:hypothetical protein
MPLTHAMERRSNLAFISWRMWKRDPIKDKRAGNEKGRLATACEYLHTNRPVEKSVPKKNLHILWKQLQYHHTTKEA